ncbi:tryptophanyl-trna synthetase [Fusarium heterosporum]|uniref:tryptophan--tRNA ligase n=1 Tax=Fusarium heterosporum TaxID=42747 RepID=A0A8H5TZS9_FUSHE|nr:tryptophanyl-trna synthetase [Fusarium heterosporum]
MPKIKLPSSRIVFSGIQPTGVPHLGNYVGALRQWVQLQHREPDTKLIYSIVDLHAITMPQPPEQLKRRKREALAALLAIGIDPERATLFYQSSLHRVCGISLKNDSVESKYPHAPSQDQDLIFIKSKLNLGERSSIDDRQAGSRLKLGLFSYPVLQAADILVHRATHVPVGHDQQQHLEFARECVTNFNAAYGNHLVSPQTLIPPVHRVMSLNDPTSKMSKSHKSEKSRILITDSMEDIKAKISSAKTDSIPGITYDQTERPGISNLLDILSIFDPEGRKVSELANLYNDISPKQLKDMVADAVVGGLDGIRDRYISLLSKGDEYLDSVEEIGAQKARKSADDTMQSVRDAVGL